MQSGSTMGNIADTLAARAGEAAIVADLKAGSEDAYAWLIATYHQSIYSLVARSVQDPADAADITQDVFLKVFRNISSFHEQASLRTWMYRIALHEASNQRRWWSRHKRQEVTIESETGVQNEGRPLCLKDTLIDGQQSPYEQAEQEQLRRWVENELRNVDEVYRTVVVLRDIEGCSYEEVAEILGIHLGTVKSRLMRGRAQLKARLSDLAAARRPQNTGSLRADHASGLQPAEGKWEGAG